MTTIVACTETNCIYCRKAITSDEKAISEHICGKTYIVIMDGRCDDYEARAGEK